jgi:hypothetical protein
LVVDGEKDQQEDGRKEEIRFSKRLEWILKKRVSSLLPSSC